MFDQFRLKEVLVQYKKDFFSKHWKDEKYKWEAVKCFQDNWDINAVDFKEMLSRSLSKTYNLLASLNNFPARMITGFAKNAPEDVRSMYIDLFDENKDVYERINTFKLQASILLEKYGNGAGQHYQYENAITTYLWLRYPDKYYIYKYSEAKSVSNELRSDYRFKKGAYTENLRNFYAFYNEICESLKQDDELVSLFKSQLTDDCYPDPELKTLTSDVGFYISRDYSKRGGSESSDNGWFPSPEEYTPGITTSEWVALLEDKNVFTQNSLEIMKRMQDYGGAATCTQLAVKYGENKNFYNAGSVGLAKRVAEKTGCPVMSGESDNSKWWPVLYIGRQATKNEDGSYVWKLRNELSEALHQVDLGNVDLYAKSESDEELGYWWLNANPKIWSFSDLQVGEVQEYTLYNENGNKRRIFQNFIDAKTGDFVIGYESNPVKQVVALVKVSAANDGQKIYFEKTESLANPIDYQTLKECPELEKMEFFQNPNGTFFKLTKGEYEFIMDMIRDENPLTPEKQIPSYTKQDFLSEVYMTEEKYDRLTGVLLNKMNIILQGAPGVGKTFAAKRLAYSLMGEEDDSRIEFVQFHQNYSYEDFMMGYKPSGDSFELKYGVFYRFCKKAENQPDKKFFFIIDEINRGNLSKIFGELLMLIEKDYRGTKATLAYNGMPFTVPDKLYIIGMMNTADRSLAMIDYALRRRFSFFEIDPGFESKGFSDYQKTLENDMFDELIQKVIELNDEISRDKSLGKGFCIGHSYFCGKTKETCTDEWMQSVVDYDILPMLSEYWFDDESKVQRWDNILHGVFQ
jgi:5-methylcytosine-specific restriction protein B